MVFGVPISLSLSLCSSLPFAFRLSVCMPGLETQNRPRTRTDHRQLHLPEGQNHPSKGSWCKYHVGITTGYGNRYGIWPNLGHLDLKVTAALKPSL